MQLDYLPIRFQKLSTQQQLTYYVADPASDEDILNAELRLNVSFPHQVKHFYQSYNGVRVESPQLEVLPVEMFNFTSPQRLLFAVVDFKHKLFFDVSHLNEAGQWDIRSEDDYLITLTMASFWSNKIWAWVEKERPIWREMNV